MGWKRKRWKTCISTCFFIRQVALEKADHLIGVTRQPSGISKIIFQPDLAEVSKYESEAPAPKEGM